MGVSRPLRATLRTRRETLTSGTQVICNGCRRTSRFPTTTALIIQSFSMAYSCNLHGTPSLQAPIKASVEPTAALIQIAIDSPSAAAVVKATTAGAEGMPVGCSWWRCRHYAALRSHFSRLFDSDAERASALF